MQKISICEKNFKISKIDKKRNKLFKKMLKLLLKKMKLFDIFWTNVSKWKYIKYWSVKRTFMYLLLYFYAVPTISSILQPWYKAKVRKTRSILTLTQKRHCLYGKACKRSSALWTRINILTWKYVNEQILQNRSTWRYITEK